MKKLVSFIIIFISAPLAVFAQIDPADTGLSQTGGDVYGTTPNIGEFIGEKLITPAFGVIGIIFLVLMIYAGFLWMTAGGNETQVTKARSIITNSLIGTLIVIVAYAVTIFLVGALSR